MWLVSLVLLLSWVPHVSRLLLFLWVLMVSGADLLMGIICISVAALVLRAAGFSGPAFALGAAFAMSVMGVACVWRSIIHGAIVQGAPVSQALLSS